MGLLLAIPKTSWADGTAKAGSEVATHFEEFCRYSGFSEVYLW